MTLSTKKCDRSECKKLTPLKSGGYPAAYCSIQCYRMSDAIHSFTRKTKKKV